MNTIEVDTTFRVNRWGRRARKNISNTFLKIGYARTASELAKFGYYKEANSCLQELRKLG